MKPITHHMPLGSSMRLLNNVTLRTKHWSLRDILRNKKATQKRVELVNKFRSPENISRRVGLVRKVSGGYHVIGLGKVEASNFDPVHAAASQHGFTHLKLGGRIFRVRS